MADVGMIFSTQTIGALKAGTKTMTRRVLKPRKGLTLGEVIQSGERDAEGYRCTREQVEEPTVAVGDRIWVKETWTPEGDPGPSFRADFGREVDTKGWGWRSGRFMPKAIARFWLDVTAVRVERLQEISEEDAAAEGMPAPYFGDGDAPFEEQAVMVSRRMQFRNLWNRLHGAGAWDANPWVAAITFKVEKGARG